MTVKGIDVSRWQPFEDEDYQAIKNAGNEYVAIRCTVGDYYTDPHFPIHWQKFGDLGLMRMPYFVVAPADSAGRKISAAAHMNRFMDAFGSRKAELPWVVDCELTRGQSKYYITEVTKGVVSSCYTALDRYPIIYTRQSWWDYNVYADPLWSKCPLWAARYYGSLPGPWGDGLYVFRDWSKWVFWQWTSHGMIPPYSGNIDLDRFNGSLEDLQDFALELTLEKKVNILWREADKRGWDLTP